jgi:hypothetical protein
MVKKKVLKWLVVISLIALIVGVVLEIIFKEGLVIMALAVFVFDILTVIFLLINKDKNDI